MTLSEAELAQQQAYLDQHRQRLAVYLGQLARMGVAHAPPEVLIGTREARTEIDRVKTILRENGVAIEDHPDDVAPAVTAAAVPASSSGGDNVGRDKIGEDKVEGNKIIITNTYIHSPPPIMPSPSSTIEVASAALPLDHIPDVAPLPSIHLMPFARNRLFVGRADALKAIAAAFSTASGHVPIAAIAGMPGIGKTNLATEFAHRYGQFFAGGVFWLSFAEPAGIPAKIVECEPALGLLDNRSLTLQERIARVRLAWEQGVPRLLVFDNCEDPALLVEHQPVTGGCCVLITSRRSEWDTTLGVQTLRLDELPRPQSITLLRGSPPALITDDSDLDAIADELGDLPLALHLAGSYLKKYRRVVSPAAYLTQLRSPMLLQHPSLRGGEFSPTGHDLDVGRTFALSVDLLKLENPTDALANDVLTRAAYFAPDEPIPRDLLAASVGREDDESVLAIEESFARLAELGLIELLPDGAVRMHRLVMAFATALALGNIPQTAVETVMLAAAAQRSSSGYVASLSAIQAHLRVVTDRACNRGDGRAASLCIALGYHLTQLWDHFGARPYYEQALTIQRAALGERHVETAARLNDLGDVLQALGDFTGAHRLHKQALAIRREILGEQHRATAQSLNNLGAVLVKQGDLVGARSYYERALDINRAVLGESHPVTGYTLCNLGSLLLLQGDLNGARPLFKQALTIHEDTLGANHPDTALSCWWVGHLLAAEGQYEDARPYLARAVAIFTQTLGPDHPRTQNCQRQLAALGPPPDPDAP